MSTTLSILEDGTRMAIIRAGLTSARGFGPSAKEAYRKANRELRCKQKWGALHSLMDSTATGGCWDDWKRQVAQMQRTIDDLEGEISRLICPF